MIVIKLGAALSAHFDAAVTGTGPLGQAGAVLREARAAGVGWTRAELRVPVDLDALLQACAVLRGLDAAGSGSTGGALRRFADRFRAETGLDVADQRRADDRILALLGA